MVNKAYHKHGPKIWGIPPLWGGATGSPSNTKSPGPRPSSIPSDILGPRPTCMTSFILIRQTVWPQYTNVSEIDRQDRTGQTDNGPIA